MKLINFGFVLLLTATSAIAQHSLIGNENTFNSYADELNPLLSQDGQTLYFVRGHHNDNVGGRPDPGDVWYSTVDDSSRWSAAEPLSGKLNNKYFNGVVGFLRPDWLMVYGHYGSSSSPPGAKGISLAKEKDHLSSYSTPEPALIKYYKDKGELYGYSISANKKILLLSMESYKTLGAEDIYVSFLDPSGKFWDEPINLGSQINTPLQELAPYLSADNRTLYFSSNGHAGYGSRDIFCAERLDDTWMNWSTPKNMGPEINTDGAEMYFQYFPQLELAMYTTTTNSDGYGDIRFKDYTIKDMEELIGAEIVIPVDTPLVEEIIVVIEEKKPDYKAPIEFVQIIGEIRSSATNDYVASRLIFSSATDSVLFNETIETTGVYTFNLAEAGQYDLTIQAEGFISQSVSVAINDGLAPTYEVNIVLEPITVGTTVQLEHVLFKRGTTELLESSFKELDLIAQMMIDNPGMDIQLEGHTDNQGNAKLNKILSQERVDAVIEYFSAKGIGDNRLSGKGYGGTKPIASNANEETRRLNRRVEFTIVKQ